MKHVITAGQQSWGKVMFPVVSVCQSVYVGIPTLQGPNPRPPFVQGPLDLKPQFRGGQMTGACENIAFPQLLLMTVKYKNLHMSVCLCVILAGRGDSPYEVVAAGSNLFKNKYFGY